MDALDQLGRSDVNLMLVDLWMPVMDGATFLAEARRRGFQAPALIISASDDADRVARATGCDGFVPKPFNLGELLVRMRSILRNRERLAS